jgi:hypothetical protein
MLRHKVTLAKMVLDEEEDEEISDFRILADLIIKNFPWPIGVELRRLFSGSMRQLDRMRLDQIFKTIERSMQFLSFVMLSQLVKEKSDGRISVPESFSREFSNRFLILSMGNFAWLIEVSEIFLKSRKRNGLCLKWPTALTQSSIMHLISGFPNAMK